MTVLALGLGATLFMFTVVKGYMLAPLPYPQGDRIMFLSRTNSLQGVDGMGVPAREYLEWQQSQESFAALGAYYTNNVTLADGEGAERVRGAFVTPSTFDVVQVEAHLGRTLLPRDGMPGAPWVIVLGYDVWQHRYAGDPAILGKTIRATGVPATVVGVMPDGFQFPSLEQVWIPLKLELSDFGGGANRYLDTVGRLRPDVTLNQARAEFAILSTTIGETYPESRGFTATIEPFQHAYVTPATRTVILAMAGGVLFLLLIACSNVANLLLARTTSRQRDVALRTALGAGRGHIVADVLVESLLLVIGGSIIGYFLADLALELTRRAYVAADVYQPFWVVLEIDNTALLMAAATALASALVAGLIPALRAVRTDVNEYLKGGTSCGGGTEPRSAFALVAGQIALSCILLLCAGLMIRTVQSLEERPLGISNRNLLTGSIDLPFTRYPDKASWYRFYDELAARLRAEPNIVDATVASSYPGLNSWSATYRTRTTDVAADRPLPMAQYVSAMDNYADMLGMKLIRGRWFDERDHPESELVTIVDNRFASQVLGPEDPIGKQIAFAPGRPAEPPSEWRTIIGVTESTFMGRIDSVDRPAILVPLRQEPYVFMKVAIHAIGNPLLLAATLRDTVSAIDPEVAVFWIRTYDNWVWAGNFESRSVSIVFSVFGVVALLLAGAGIYGVLSYSVVQRTREIGLRRALGAANGRVLTLVLGQGLRQLVIGIGVGLILGVIFARLLAGWLYGVTPLDPATLATIVPILTIVALLASLLPALRAIRMSPTDALRSE
jgi:predicted permease